MPKNPQRIDHFFHTCDILLCMFVFFPLMVLYWRGIWDLWGIYVLPGRHPAQQWVLLSISTMAMGGYYCGPLLDHCLDRSKRVNYFIFTRFYMYAYAAFYMCYWRSLWELADFYFPMDLASSIINIAFSYFSLLMLRSSRSCIFPPMFTNLDTREHLLIPTTRFNTKPFTVAYFFDSLFSHYVLQALTILTWRGMWNLVSFFVYTKDPSLSDWICFGVGNGTVLIIYFLELPLGHIAIKMEEKGFYYKLIWEDVVYTFILLCLGVLWRGGWNLTSTYIFPDTESGGWVCFCLGTAGLTVLQLFSYVSAHGIAIDGVEKGTEAFFPNLYLRAYIKHKESPEMKYQVAVTADVQEAGGDPTVQTTGIQVKYSRHLRVCDKKHLTV